MSFRQYYLRLFCALAKQVFIYMFDLNRKTEGTLPTACTSSNTDKGKEKCKQLGLTETSGNEAKPCRREST